MKTELTQILNSVKNGSMTVEEAALKLKITPFEDIGYAKIDLHRKIRQGAAEVIYGAGKTAVQIAGITETMLKNGQENILITRLDPKAAEFLKKTVELDYHEDAKIGIHRTDSSARWDRENCCCHRRNKRYSGCGGSGSNCRSSWKSSRKAVRRRCCRTPQTAKASR